LKINAGFDLQCDYEEYSSDDLNEISS